MKKGLISISQTMVIALCATICFFFTVCFADADSSTVYNVGPGQAYATLSEAVDAIPSGESATIKISGSVTETKPTVSSGKNITIIGDDGTINTSHPITVSDGMLTLGGSGSLEIKSDGSYSSGTAIQVNGGTFYLKEGVTVDVAANKTAIGLQGVSDGNITGGKVTSGGVAIGIGNGSTISEISGGTFTDGGTGTAGAAINISGSTVEKISGGTFVSNGTNHGVFVTSGGKIGSITGGEFESNASSGTYGALTVSGSNSSVGDIADGTFTSTRYGIWLNAGSIDNVLAGTITGGDTGVLINEGGKVQTIGDNVSVKGKNAALYLWGGTVSKITGGTYECTNTTTSDSSIAYSIYARRGSIDEISGGKFIGVSAALAAGSNFSSSDSGSVSKISGGEFVSNYGYAVNVLNYGKVGTITGGLFYSDRPKVNNKYVYHDAIVNKNASSPISIEPDLSDPQGQCMFYGSTSSARGSRWCDNVNGGKANITIPEGYHIADTSSGYTKKIGEYSLRFTYLRKYSVLNYDKNSATATGTMEPSYEADVYSGALSDSGFAIVRENEFTNIEAYTFDSWNTKADGSGVKFAKNGRFNFIWYGSNGEGTLYAQWKPVEYTITYDLAGGTVADSANPDKYTIESDDITLVNPTKTGYTFAGWTGTDLDDATEDVTIASGSTGNREYTATWTINKYTITFVDEDGTVLDKQEVEYGQVPVYAGERPEKADKVDTKTETVAKVDEEGNPVLDEDGNPVTEEEITETNTTKYTFNGWDKDIVAATEDTTYTATYTNADTSEYLIKFVDDNGKVLSKKTYEKGTNASDIDRPADPVKSSTAEYSYKFAGWSPSIENVTGSRTYTATYKATKRKYTVTFKNDDGTTLSTGSYEYGQIPKYTGRTPAKAATSTYTYSFDGWTPAIQAVTGDATYTAKYTSARIPDNNEDNNGGNNGGGNGNRGGNAAAATATAPAANGTPANNTANIADNNTPQAQTPATIDDNDTPLASGEGESEGAWALINLICAALSTIGAALAVFRKRDDDDADEYEDDDEVEADKRKARIAKGVGIAAAVGSILAFILTEDMSLPMALIDKWTLLMAALLAGQAVTAGLTKKYTETEYEEVEEE